jgi:hypothetical protein
MTGSYSGVAYERSADVALGEQVGFIEQEGELAPRRVGGVAGEAEGQCPLDLSPARKTICSR